MRELNAYQQDVIACLQVEGRATLARKVYDGWMNGVNEHIPALNGNGKHVQLRAPRRRNLMSHRLLAFA